MQLICMKDLSSSNIYPDETSAFRLPGIVGYSLLCVFVSSNMISDRYGAERVVWFHLATSGILFPYAWHQGPLYWLHKEEQNRKSSGGKTLLISRFGICCWSRRDKSRVWDFRLFGRFVVLGTEVQEYKLIVPCQRTETLVYREFNGWFHE